MGELLLLVDVYLIVMKYLKFFEYLIIYNKFVFKYVFIKCGWKLILVVDFFYYNFLGCVIYISYVNL